MVHYPTSTCSQKFSRCLINKLTKTIAISACTIKEAVAAPPKNGVIGLGVSFIARTGQKTGL